MATHRVKPQKLISNLIPIACRYWRQTEGLRARAIQSMGIRGFCAKRDMNITANVCRDCFYKKKPKTQKSKKIK